MTSIVPLDLGVKAPIGISDEEGVAELFVLFEYHAVQVPFVSVMFANISKLS
jgi:hypothetical protein